VHLRQFCQKAFSVKLNFITAHIIKNILGHINSKDTKILGGKNKRHKCLLSLISVTAQLKCLLFALALKYKR